MRTTRYMLIASALLGCGQAEAPTHEAEHVATQSQAVGIGDDNTGRPLGGGEDYGAWITAAQADEVVDTPQEFVEALSDAANAVDPFIIYVADDAVIDLSEFVPLNIPANVTLASGRGRDGSLGGLLWSGNHIELALFNIAEGGVRITGLRLRGPDTSEAPPGGCPAEGTGADAIGIHIAGKEGNEVPGVEIDNNEMWGWPWAAVWSEAKNGTAGGIFIHHNHIHHDRRRCPNYGLGYGIQADVGSTLIESNIFNDNRESVASKGLAETDYEARFNLVLRGASSQSFDCHGGADRPASEIETPADLLRACRTVLIHHNTIQQTESHSVRIRGVPDDVAEIFNNEFLCVGDSTCVEQINYFGNFFPHDNNYEVDKFPAWFVTLSGYFDEATEPGPGSYWAFRRFEGTPLDRTKVAFGDFDGDGTTDALKSTGSEWLMSSGARLSWTHWNTSVFDIADLGFANLCGGAETDAFAQYDGQWWCSVGASEEWTFLNTSAYGVADVAFANFGGTGFADVIRTTGSTWEVSTDGTAGWSSLTTSSFELAELRFGQFVGNVRADAIRTTGAEWLVSDGGDGNWEHLNWSSAVLEDLTFGDFNGDGTTDVLRVNNGALEVSFGGAGGWVAFNSTGYQVSDFRVADVNGDGRSDILVAGDGTAN